MLKMIPVLVSVIFVVVLVINVIAKDIQSLEKALDPIATAMATQQVASLGDDGVRR